MHDRKYFMRTTIAIDDDVLAAAKAIARQRHQTVGKVVSDLARSSLRPPATGAERNGVPLLPVRKADVIVTPDIINTLRDELA
jgi:Arc/MetJ family transcription regulator